MIKIAKDIIELLKKLRSKEYFTTLFNLSIVCKDKLDIIDDIILQSMIYHHCRYNYKELVQYFLLDSAQTNNKTI